MRSFGQVADVQRRFGIAQEAQGGPMAEDRADSDSPEPSHRAVRPVSRVGATSRTRKDRHRRARQPRALDGRDQLDGRFADQPDGSNVVLLQQTRRDAFGQPVHLRPWTGRPLIGFFVQHHQVMRRSDHRLAHRGSEDAHARSPAPVKRVVPVIDSIPRSR